MEHIRDLIAYHAGERAATKIERIFLSQAPSAEATHGSKPLGFEVVVANLLQNQNLNNAPFYFLNRTNMEQEFSKYLHTDAQGNAFINHKELEINLWANLYCNADELADLYQDVDTKTETADQRFTMWNFLKRLFFRTKKEKTAYEHLVDIIGINLMKSLLSKANTANESSQKQYMDRSDAQAVATTRLHQQPATTDPREAKLQMLHDRVQMKDPITHYQGDYFGSTTVECQGMTKKYIQLPETTDAAFNAGVLHEMGHLAHDSSLHKRNLNITLHYYTYEILSSQLSSNTKLALFLAIGMIQLAYEKIDEYRADSFMLRHATTRELEPDEAMYLERVRIQYSNGERGTWLPDISNISGVSLPTTILMEQLLSDVHPSDRSRAERIRARIRELEEQEQSAAHGTHSRL